MITRTIQAPDAVLTYDVHQPAEDVAGPRPLFILGSPMGASGFKQLVPHFSDRTVLTYDPRGMERSSRDPDSALTAEVHAEDYHRVVADAGLGPVDVFASSGGAMCGLHWLVEHPDDVATFVAHEPPLVTLLADREIAIAVNVDIAETYQRDGFGPAMAKFIQMVMRDSPLPADYLEQPAPDPAQFGLPTEDDGSRSDPLLSGNLTMPPFEPNAEALRSSAVRIVPAIGERGGAGLPRRGGQALGELLGSEPVIFPGDHGGFTKSEWTPDNDPEAFARHLREVLAGP